MVFENNRFASNRRFDMSRFVSSFKKPAQRIPFSFRFFCCPKLLTVQQIELPNYSVTYNFKGSLFYSFSSPTFSISPILLQILSHKIFAERGHLFSAKFLIYCILPSGTVSSICFNINILNLLSF